MPRWIITFGRDVLIGLFWVWGAFGLIGNLLTLNSQIGVEALSSQLLWIGGMLLFGVGALWIRAGLANKVRAAPKGREEAPRIAVNIICSETPFAELPRLARRRKSAGTVAFRGDSSQSRLRSVAR